MTSADPDERKRLIEESIAAFYRRNAAEKQRPVKQPTRFKRGKPKTTK